MNGTSMLQELKSKFWDLNTSNAEITPVSVVVPTYNRPDALLVCLQHLEMQTWKRFEVVVLDDGSSDETSRFMEQYVALTPLALNYVRQPNSGPARARNVAISLLRSPVCIMIGDDIFVSPSFVATHLELHERLSGDNVAALGYTRWAEEGQIVTPFMRWLDSNGFQFSYGELLAGKQPSWHHFYTSNLSLKTSRLLKQPFNESFQKAAMEDIELGYRLSCEGGLDMHFLLEASAEHLHPTNLSKACRRMIDVGVASHLFHELWPEHRPKLKSNFLKAKARKIILNERLSLPLLRKFASFVMRIYRPNRITHVVLGLHHTLGYRKAVSQASIHQRT